MSTVTVTSFGYGHPEGAPTADLTVDARCFRNPHRDPQMRFRTGLEDTVRRHVLATSGVLPAVHAAVEEVVRLAQAAAGPITVAVGCVGGRHRSVAMAAQIGAELRTRGIQVEIYHRDVTRPVIQR